MTAPSGLKRPFTAPTAAGSYAVAVTVNDLNFQGGASDTLTVAKATQTVTFTKPSGTLTVGTPIALSATTSSGLGVTFSIVSGNATLSGSSLTLASTAPVVVRATAASDGNYDPASAEKIMEDLRRVEVAPPCRVQVITRRAVTKWRRQTLLSSLMTTPRSPGEACSTRSSPR